MSITEIQTRTETPTLSELPSGETRDEAAQRYHTEADELALDDTIPKEIVDAKRDTANLLTKQAKALAESSEPESEPADTTETPEA